MIFEINKMSTTIKLEDVKKYFQLKEKIERSELRDITFTRKGEKIEVDQDLLNKWEETGLLNSDYIASVLLTPKEKKKLNLAHIGVIEINV